MVFESGGREYIFHCGGLAPSEVKLRLPELYPVGRAPGAALPSLQLLMVCLAYHCHADGRLGMPSAPSIRTTFSRMLAGLVIHDTSRPDICSSVDSNTDRRPKLS
jgi:hypothetical protein